MSITSKINDKFSSEELHKIYVINSNEIDSKSLKMYKERYNISNTSIYPFHFSITNNFINNKTSKNKDTEIIIKKDNNQNIQNINVLNSNNTFKSASDSNTLNLLIINDSTMLKNFFYKLKEIIQSDIKGDYTNEIKIQIINEIKSIYEFIMNKEKSDKLQKKNEEVPNHINEKCCTIFEKKKLNDFTLYGNCNYSKLQCLEKEMIYMKDENVNLKNEMKSMKKKIHSMEKDIFNQKSLRMQNEKKNKTKNLKNAIKCMSKSRKFIELNNRKLCISPNNQYQMKLNRKKEEISQKKKLNKTSFKLMKDNNIRTNFKKINNLIKLNSEISLKKTSKNKNKNSNKKNSNKNLKLNYEKYCKTDI